MHDDGLANARRVLILGGTLEARRLAETLVGEGLQVVTSLAGRTREPVLPPGEIRIGGFGGAEGLARYLQDAAIDLMIDATHPFAQQISRNAVDASARTGVRLVRHQRPGWSPTAEDIWVPVASLDDAAQALPEGATVFLALGRQYLDAFLPRSDCQFIIRMVDPPEKPLGFARHCLVLGKPSTAVGEEIELLRKYGVTHLVCRNSGGDAGYAKIEAARSLKIPVILIERA